MSPGDRAEDLENSLTAPLIDDDLRATLTAVYPQLRRIARGLLSRERPDHTLQPTALANEVITRLLKRELEGEDRRMIVSSGIREMQTILIDSGRRRQFLALNAPIDLNFESAQPQIEKVVHLQLCLQELGKVDPRTREVVELRFFTGLTIPEVAEFLGVSTRTVNQDWEFARRWLAKHWCDGADEV